MSSSKMTSNQQTSSNHSTLVAQQATPEHQTQSENELSHEEQTTPNGETLSEQQTSSEQHARSEQHASSEQHARSEQHASSEQHATFEQHVTFVKQSSVQQTISEQHITSEQQTSCVQQTSSEQQTTTLSSNTTYSFEPMMTVINKIADGQRVPPQTTMKYEMLRFCTLRSFPKGNKPYITRLAGAGFYYANEGDEVVCYCCARRRRNWTEFENPMEVHRELNPNCSFLIRNSEVNVSVRRQSIEKSTGESHSNLTTINRGQSNANFHNELTEVKVSSAFETGSQIQTNQNSEHSSFASNVISSRERNQSVSLLPVDVPQTSSENQSSNNSTGLRHWSEEDDQWIEHSRWSNECSYVRQIRGREFVNIVQMAVHKPEMNQFQHKELKAWIGSVSSSVAPKHPNYISQSSRLSSYSDCGDIVIPPDRLAQAGFFYAGFGDCVRCFQCGFGLRHWSEEDDPWIEHSRWSNECSYVRQIRGREFVNIVQMAVEYSQNVFMFNLYF
ncbi:inhibitor of apoptosis protein-like [Ruditapes philippinarum]|uniref:inhibitor of apoptosis protein-like n=1 Tax=Ruditapes philippinarum TaxID=129788 RepID=UPI00295AB23F|nr:inhibitor of apoptosis protein-like [Ruditapes philippinarum]